MSALQRRYRRLDPTTLVVLLLTVMGYPALRASGLIPVPETGTRTEWWLFWLIVAIGHWTCFALVAFSLRRSGTPWSTIGVDWYWLRSRWRWLAAVVGGLVVAAIVAPPIYYGGELPLRDGLFPLQPKSTAERLFWILGGGVTAGVVEETLFRGFALTRLGRLLGSPWLALPVTMVAFVFLHGSPPNLAIALNFAVVGAVFGVVFILMRCRRLEVLILVHAAVNVLYIFLP